MTFDARSIANFILDYAGKRNLTISNMSINKIVYFLHAEYLLANNKPLISAKIEAWDHGPVIREVYNAFKNFGAGAISDKAIKIDHVLQKKIVVNFELPLEVSLFLLAIMPAYVSQTASQLRSLSHELGGPWDVVFNHGGNTNPGMEITNSHILTHEKARTRH